MKKDPTPDGHPLAVFKSLTGRAQALAWSAAESYREKAMRQATKAHRAQESGRDADAARLRLLSTRNRHREESARRISELAERLRDTAQSLANTEADDPPEPDA